MSSLRMLKQWQAEQRERAEQKQVACEAKKVLSAQGRKHQHHGITLRLFCKERRLRVPVDTAYQRVW